MRTVRLSIDQMLLADAMIVSHDRLEDQQRRGIDRAGREIHGSGRSAEIARERAEGPAVGRGDPEFPTAAAIRYRTIALVPARSIRCRRLSSIFYRNTLSNYRPRTETAPSPPPPKSVH